MVEVAFERQKLEACINCLVEHAYVDMWGVTITELALAVKRTIIERGSKAPEIEIMPPHGMVSYV